MLKIIGAGLSRTGTTSLHEALQQLGFKSIHHDTHRLNDLVAGSAVRADFRRYDDVDAVFDLPASLFYGELLDAYPEAKVILTHRDVDEWWRSINRLFSDVKVGRYPNVISQIASKFGLNRFVGSETEHVEFLRNLRYRTYGAPEPCEYLYKRAYEQHCAAVVARVPSSRLLIMNVAAGDGWQKLCGFLGIPAPSTPFPFANQGPVSVQAPAHASVRPATEPSPTPASWDFPAADCGQDADCDPERSLRRGARRIVSRKRSFAPWPHEGRSPALEPRSRE